MGQTTIKWQPVVTEGEPLSVPTPEVFIMQMQTAFPGEWPLRLTAKNIERLEGMAAATQMVGNPYLALLQHLKRHKSIFVWPEFGEGAI
jgi:hypothetical protein